MRLPIKIIGTVLLVVFSSLACQAMSAQQANKPRIPPDLDYEYIPVPASENAIINWRRAASLKVSLNSHERRLVKYCWDPGVREPSSNELSDLQSWLKRNRQALALFDASLLKPRAQWPERNPQKPQPEIATFLLMIQARLFKADQLAEQGKFSSATKLLEDNLKLSRLGAEGDAALLNYLIACRARTMTQDAILRLACRKATPIPVLEELLTNLPSLDNETNIYDHALRVEFVRDYHYTLDLKKLTDSLAKMSGTNAALYLSFYPDDLQRAFKVLLDPSLVPLHSKPYDAYTEIEKSIRDFRIYRTNSLTPWTKRDGTVELEHEEAITKLSEDIAPLMELVQNDPLPLSQQNAQKARLAYDKIKNPIGRILDTSIVGFIASDLKVCQARTEREATRAFLALVIFKRQHGQLPATLSDLVTDKILKTMPVDLFCGEPLHYSRKTRKIWSISDNGEDDHGESGKIRWFEKDAVWQIPIVN